MNNITAEEAKKRTAWAKAGNFRIESRIGSIMGSIHGESERGESRLVTGVELDISEKVIEQLRKLGYACSANGDALEVAW